ncbi:MAG: carbohydrate porin [Candidatus Omnitrophota bacterium]
MNEIFKKTVFVCALFFFFSGISFADEVADIRHELESLKSRIAFLEAKLEDKESSADSPGLINSKAPCCGNVEDSLLGMNVAAGATFITQMAVSPNNNADKDDVTDASYSVSLEFEKEFQDKAKAFLCLETGDGQGVEDELEVFSNVNRDADDSDSGVSVSAAWYEHYLFEKQLDVTFGKLDPTCYLDQNEIANDECHHFVGRMFRNSSVIDFPDNGPGLRLRLLMNKIDWIEVESQFLDGDGDWEDISDNFFISYQVSILPKILADLQGSYRLYGWTKRGSYTEWLDSSLTDENRYGFGLSFDQQIFESLTVFCRYGWVEDTVYDIDITSSSGANYSLEQAFSGGIRLSGTLWGRGDDHLAMAGGVNMPSSEYEDAGLGLFADDEYHLETYYSWQVNDNFILSPDMQIIWNPLGSDYQLADKRRDDTAAVFSLRGQVDF